MSFQDKIKGRFDKFNLYSKLEDRFAHQDQRKLVEDYRERYDWLGRDKMLSVVLGTTDHVVAVRDRYRAWINDLLGPATVEWISNAPLSVRYALWILLGFICLSILFVIFDGFRAVASLVGAAKLLDQHRAQQMFNALHSFDGDTKAVLLQQNLEFVDKESKATLHKQLDDMVKEDQALGAVACENGDEDACMYHDADVLMHEVNRLSSDEQYAMVKPWTAIPKRRLEHLVKEYHTINEKRVEGDVVEIGVGRGGVAMTLMYEQLRLKSLRDFWLFDLFDATAATRGKAHWHAPKHLVRNNVFYTGYPRSKIHFVAGKAHTVLTHDKSLPEKIALLKLDIEDTTEITTYLEIFWDRLVPGGLFWLDDYCTNPKVTRSADEFFAKRGMSAELRYKSSIQPCLHYWKSLDGKEFKTQTGFEGRQFEKHYSLDAKRPDYNEAFLNLPAYIRHNRIPGDQPYLHDA